MTSGEVAAVPLFAGLSEAALERLSRHAADISLVAGEFAAREGDERALFALLDGRIEAVKEVDGIERVVGVREPGEIFGEVPLVLGTLFPVGFRAAEHSRVMRIGPRDYHALAAAEPGIVEAVGKLAAHRMAGPRGLSGLAAEPPPPRAVVVGHRWDPHCSELRRFLERNQVSFVWVPADAPDAAEQWEGPIPSDEDLPAIRVIGGKMVVRPELRRVAELLDLGTEPLQAEYDVVIVGAGPSGLAAAVYGASEGLRTLVVEREAPGGQAGSSSRIENYLGFPGGVSGEELANRALQQARRLGAEILVTRSINRLDALNKQIHLDGGDVLQAKTVVLAAGVSWRRLEVEGGDHLAGKGLSYGAARSDAPNVHGLDIHIVGAGNSAGQAAMFFATHARTVTLLCRGASLEKSMSHYLIEQMGTRPNIQVLHNRELVAVHGENSLEAIDLRDKSSDEISRVESGGVFIFIGADAETGWLPADIELDDHGYVLTGSDLGLSGVWPLERDPLSARDERAGNLRLRRRPLGPGQTSRRRRWRRQHGHCLRAPVPTRGAKELPAASSVRRT